MAPALALDPPAPALLRIGFALTTADPYWVQVREAAKQRAAHLGIDLVRLPLIPYSASGESSLSTLEDLRASDLRALIGHAASPATMLTFLDAGLPILCAEETTLTHPLLASVRGLDRAAEMGAEQLAHALGAHQGRAGCLLLVGGLEDHLATTLSRLDGFRRVFARFPGLRVLSFPSQWRYEEVYAHLVEEGDALRARLAELAGAANPAAVRFDGIVGLSDPIALAARDGCRALGLADDATLVVGINGDPLAIAAVEAGSMHATVETNPQALGYALVDYARQAAHGAPLPDHFGYQMELITAANVSQVAARRLVAIAELPSRLVDVNRRQEEERLRRLRASLEMNRSLGAIVDWGELREMLAEIIRSRYGCRRARLFQWSADEQALLLLADLPSLAAEGARIAVPVSNAAETSLLAAALLRNRCIYIPDTRASLRFPADPAWPATRARVVLPIRFADRTIGVLDLHSDQPTVRTPAELDALQSLADQLGGAMQNAALFAQARAARAQAEESNRLRARLLAHLSDGLRSPLNVILGYVQSALADANPYGVELPAALLQDLRTIARSGADLNRLVGELLDLAQVESGGLPLYPERVDLRALLTDLFESAARVLDGGRELTWQLQLPATLPTITVDPVRLRSVLLSLLGNAAHATASGSIRLGAAAGEGEVHLWVEDTGAGVAPSLTEGAGAPDADAATPGLGLGIAHRLVELMGGRLELRSRPNEGTLVRLTLPCVAPGAGGAGETEGTEGAEGTKGTEDAEGVTAPYRMALDRATVLVKRGVETIERRYDDPDFDRDELARVLSVSPSYVSRLFQRELGMSPWELLTRIRIEHARTLLLAPEPHPIAEIALRVGYTDPAYFARTFRRLTGRAPLAFRQAGEPPSPPTA